jgi:hypothetical protein
VPAGTLHWVLRKGAQGLARSAAGQAYAAKHACGQAFGRDLSTVFPAHFASGQVLLFVLQQLACMHLFRMHAFAHFFAHFACMHFACMHCACMHFACMHFLHACIFFACIACVSRKSALSFFARTTVSIVFCVYCVVCVCTGEGIYTWTRTRARIVRAQIQPLITDFHAEIMTRDSPFYGRQRARPRARILMPPTSRSVVNSVRMHACTFSHACVCVCAHFRMHAYVYVFAHACVCVFSHLRMHAYVYFRMHAYVYFRMHAYVYRMHADVCHIFACMRMCQKIDYNKRGLKLQYVYYNTLAMITLKYRGQWELQ